jgi:hypothetical protein
MRREARKLMRDGNERAASAMGLAASEQRLQEGSAISVQEETLRERDLMRARDRGLMRQQRDSVLKPEAGAAPAPTTGAPAAGAAAPRPGLSRPASTPSLGAPATSGVPILGGVLDAARGIPTAPREGRINDMPASQAIAEVGKPAQFGKEFATQNIQKLGLSGAIADYRRREAEAGKPAEPGNMAELRERDAAASPSSTVGPLQSYLNQNIADRGSRKITAGLNAAPTPKLDTSSLVRTLKKNPLETARATRALRLADARVRPFGV